MFELQFNPLQPEQHKRRFMAKALDADAVRFSAEQRGRLRRLDLSTPGDFAAVKRQVDVRDETFEPDAFLSKLEAEHRVKLEVPDRRGIRLPSLKLPRAAACGPRTRVTCLSRERYRRGGEHGTRMRRPRVEASPARAKPASNNVPGSGMACASRNVRVNV